MRTRIAIVIALGASACGAHIRREVVGTRAAPVAPRGIDPQDSWPAANPQDAMALAPGTYELALWFDVPRAQVIDWSLRCGAITDAGSVGETLEQYRARRVAELAEERARHARAVAGVTSAVVGAVAPTARVRTVTPIAPGVAVVEEATVRVDAHAVGEAVAPVPDPDLALAPGDVGAGRYGSDTRIALAEAATCTLVGLADDATVAGHVRFTRVRDLDAEARARAAVVREAAIVARGRVQTQLVIAGADEGARRRRLDAAIAVREARLSARWEAQARAEAEVRGRAELRAQIAARAQTAAFGFRAEYEAWLVGHCHADPHARERAQLAQREADARLRARTEAELARHRHAGEVAIATRAQVRDYLVQLGAHARPPRPPIPDEERGPAPVPDAVWVAGSWAWSGAAWVWTAGGWRDDTRFAEVGRSTPVVIVPPIAIDVARTLLARPRATAKPTPKRPVVRDHR